MSSAADRLIEAAEKELNAAASVVEAHTDKRNRAMKELQDAQAELERSTSWLIGVSDALDALKRGAAADFKEMPAFPKLDGTTVA